MNGRTGGRLTPESDLAGGAVSSGCWTPCHVACDGDLVCTFQKTEDTAPSHRTSVHELPRSYCACSLIGQGFWGVGVHRGGELCTFVNGFVRPVPEGGDFVGVTLLGSPSKQGCCHVCL